MHYELMHYEIINCITKMRLWWCISGIWCPQLICERSLWHTTWQTQANVHVFDVNLLTWYWQSLPNWTIPLTCWLIVGNHDPSLTYDLTYTFRFLIVIRAKTSTSRIGRCLRNQLRTKEKGFPSTDIWHLTEIIHWRNDKCEGKKIVRYKNVYLCEELTKT
jgi:hypothetical protein